MSSVFCVLKVSFASHLFLEEYVQNDRCQILLTLMKHTWALVIECKRMRLCQSAVLGQCMECYVCIVVMLCTCLYESETAMMSKLQMIYDDSFRIT